MLNPIAIGNITIDPPLFLAPMAGHTNRALRTLCRDLGDCGLVCTELISSNIVKHNGIKRAMQAFDWSPDEEAPIAVQLFGNDPDAMVMAAQLVVQHGADIVDINMGCWVPKLAKKGGGAALLRDVDTATRVVEAVVKAVHVPVTVKVRSGWETGNPTAIPFARAAESVGVQAIAVHARYANQGHQGDADWDIIRQVKQAVTRIPIIGNGDVLDTEAARRMIEKTGCDGIMIGRGALGRPWLFHHIAHELRTGEQLPEPSRVERATLALQHARRTLAITKLPEYKAILEFRGQISKYMLDAPGSLEVRNRVVRVESMDELESILTAIIDSEIAAPIMTI